MFDHCIFLLRSEDLNKNAVDVIRDLYLQYKIYNFDTYEQANIQIQNIGKRNLSYSQIISENFDLLESEDIFSTIFPLFNLGDKNLIMEEIRNNYSQ